MCIHHISTWLEICFMHVRQNIKNYVTCDKSDRGILYGDNYDIKTSVALEQYAPVFFIANNPSMQFKGIFFENMKLKKNKTQLTYVLVSYKI